MTPPLDALREGLAEAEGTRVPDGLDVVDAHVHLFPPRVFAAIWRWFDAHAWCVRYRLESERVVEFLVGKGVRRLVALHYAHVPDMARSLNAYAAEIARAHREVVPLATVLPGEPDERAVLREAFGPLGLRGLKIHCHVQRIAPDDPRLDAAYAACQDAGLPLVIHAGREPAFHAYPTDPHALCGAERVARVLRRFPRLRLVVPHLGADEFEAYERLLGEHAGLTLDTTMWYAGYFESRPPAGILERFAGRIMYGTDFPNIPFAWDRELRALAAEPLSPASRRALFSGVADGLFPA